MIRPRIAVSKASKHLIHGSKAETFLVFFGCGAIDGKYQCLFLALTLGIIPGGIEGYPKEVRNKPKSASLYFNYLYN